MLEIWEGPVNGQLIIYNFAAMGHSLWVAWLFGERGFANVVVGKRCNGQRAFARVATNPAIQIRNSKDELLGASECAWQRGSNAVPDAGPGRRRPNRFPRREWSLGLGGVRQSSQKLLCQPVPRSAAGAA
jgi:hypothetical protein